MKKFPTIWVEGNPRPKGSWTPVQTKTGIKMRPANPKWAKWFKYAKTEVERLWKGPVLKGPVIVHLSFFLPRPKTVKRDYPITKYDGDADKHARAILDSMTGSVYVDDAQVIDVHASKRYADKGKEGVRITVSAL